MLTLLYNLTIQPLILIVELIFSLFYKLIGHPGYAIIGVSVAVNFLILPLYRRADAVQEEEREKQAEMAGWVGHIKKTFRGDEQYMMLSTYYRQQNYHPLSVLRSSVSLLLQVPFFIAAYRYLSHLSILQDASFGPIANLGAPDQMLQIGGLSLNLLPILMTVLNLISGFIYTKGFPLKSKIQSFGLTLLFLILLYNSPAGLVLYWTMNNLFSLVKNLFLKVIRHPRQVFAIAAAVCVSLVCWRLFQTGRLYSRKRMAVGGLIWLAGMLPLFCLLWDHMRPAWLPRSGMRRVKEPVPAALPVLGGVFLTILLGAVIPLSVVSSSPTEFINVAAYRNPIRYVLNTFTISAGFFLVWAGVFYALGNEEIRHIFACGFWLLSGICVVNYMFFGKDLGTLSPDLTFDSAPVFTAEQRWGNLLVLLLVVLVLYGIWTRLKKHMASLYGILIFVMVVLAGSDIVEMNRSLAEVENKKRAQPVTEEEIDPVIRLSKTGKNILVLMLDRGISSYVPYMFAEKTQLAEQFSDFVYYPNTLSFGGHTNYGAPGLFGGYEYTPAEMNKRESERLSAKHNEALKVMPELFRTNGYEVTICDPPYAGYRSNPDLSIFDGMEGVRAYNTKGAYSSALREHYGAVLENVQMRNFFFYSIFKSAPLILQPAVYDNGTYLSTSMDLTTYTDVFLDWYAVLERLKDLTETTEEETGQFLMLTNDTTHSPVPLQMPDYVPADSVNNDRYQDLSRFNLNGAGFKMKTPGQMNHYYVNMTTFLHLGEWFDYLKAEGVYDNTRIIICSDHGYYLKLFPYLRFDDVDIMMYNALLMVKDFAGSTDCGGAEDVSSYPAGSVTDGERRLLHLGAEEAGITVSEKFMTNADVPTLALAGIVADPVNPFTGKKISSDEKTAHPQEMTTSKNHRLRENHGNTFDTSDGDWYLVQENIFDKSNWQKLTE